MCGGTILSYLLCFTRFVLLWFNKIFKLVVPKSSAWPKIMYAKHWRKLALTTSLGNFPTLLAP